MYIKSVAFINDIINTKLKQQTRVEDAAKLPTSATLRDNNNNHVIVQNKNKKWQKNANRADGKSTGRK